MSCENGLAFDWIVIDERYYVLQENDLRSQDTAVDFYTRNSRTATVSLVCSDSHKMHRLISSFHNRKTHTNTLKPLSAFVSRLSLFRRQQKSFTRVAAQSKNRHESTEIMNEKHTEIRRWNAEATCEERKPDARSHTWTRRVCDPNKNRKLKISQKKKL